MSEVASLNIDLSLLTAKFNEGCARASKAMSDFEKSVKPIARSFDKFGKQLESTGKSLTTNLTLPILAAGAAIGVALNKTAAYGDEINNMAVRTGFTRESLQELKFAADQTGVSMDGVQTATVKLNKVIGEAASGNKNVSDRFADLGVAIKNTDGTLRPANKVFMDTVAALNRIPDETTRNAIGIELMGKGYSEIIPLVAEGKDGLERFGQEARNAGLVMSEEAVIAADAFGDKMDKLKAQLGHAGMEIATAFMPLVEQLAGFIEANVVPALKAAADWFKGLSDTQKNWVVGIAAALAAIGPLVAIFGAIAGAIGTLISLAPAMAAAWALITGPVGLVALAVGAVVTAIGFLIKKAADAAGGFGNLWNYIKGVFTNLINYAKAAGKILHGALTFNTDGSLTQGIDDFNAAIKTGSQNTLEAHRQAGILIEKYNGQRDASLAAAEATRKHIAEMRNSKPAVDALNISLWEHKVKLDGLKPSFDNIQKAEDDIIISTGAVTAKFITGGMIVAGAVEQMDYSVKTLSETIAENEVSLLKWAEVAKQVGEIGTQMAADVFNGIGEAIGGILSGSQKAGEAMKNLFIGVFNNLKQIGSALIATGVPMLLAVVTAPEGAKMIAAGTGIVAAATAGTAIVHSFAEGGLVFGDTLSLIGEGRGTTRSNPEVVAPLDKLMGFMGGEDNGMTGKVEFIIQGETLRAVLAKNNSSRRYLGNGG